MRHALSSVAVGSAIFPLVATPAGSAWKRYPVGAMALQGSSVAVAVDGTGRPHVVYWLSADGGLRHAWRDGGRWRIETIDTLSSGSYGGAIVVDSNDRLHVAYSAGRPGGFDLKYAVRDGQGWTLTTVGAGGFSSAIGLDAQDHPHVSHVGNGGELLHSSFDGAAWTTETIAAGATWFGGTSIAIAHPGIVHIAFSVRSATDTIYWANNSSGGGS